LGGRGEGGGGMGAVSSSAFVRHRNCSTYHGEFNISVSNNYFTAKMPNILKIKHFKKGPLKILNFNFLTKIVFFEKEIFLENFEISLKIIYIIIVRNLPPRVRQQ
jgi:hypothetical protein